ncbi:DUF2853 family protein [Aquimarina sp. ERC-38]|uniref:DUF2853 family protein n=1 Tax=Aquimarina sp. ERC-38 TaxID=2949996 RepID=UPI00224791F9|nr:DUF2853 family protein [Aquimarina sp. ERC-38]UZO79523.1 DUF2853 family protein [Aquimarina sp. ERC-38]
MSKREALITKYAEEIKSKFSEEPDMDLLTKVVIGCGPAIYGKDASTVSGGNEKEMETVKNNFIKKKLGITDESKVNEALDSVMDAYGKSNKNRYRAVVYYMLTKHFGKEEIYK